jgi:LEA14-like dessication related protein
MKKQSTVKHILWGVFILLLMAAMYVAIKYYKTKQRDPDHTLIKPRMELSHFIIKDITKESTNMEMRFQIDNPLPASVKMENLEYTISIAGVDVIKSKYTESITIEANDNSRITLPIIVKQEKLIKVLKELENSGIDSTEYNISGNAYFSFSFIKNKHRKFNFSKRLPVFIIPETKVGKIEVEKLGLNNTKLIVNVKIENKNSFPFQFNKTEYLFSVEGDELASGVMDQVITIPANGYSELTIPANVSFKEAMETMFDSWFRAGRTEYALNLETTIMSDNKSINNSKMVLVATGNLKDLKEAMKEQKK